MPNTCGTHAPYEPRVWILILKILSLLWFIAILTIYLYAAACITLGWWPVGEPPALQAGAWFLSGIAGGVGAGLYAVRGFYRAVGPPRRDDPRGRYDPRWTWWYFMRPLLGVPLGLVGYGAARTALNVVRASAPTDEATLLPFLAVAFVAGFSATELMNWLQRRGETIFAVSPSRARGPAQPRSRRIRVGRSARNAVRRGVRRRRMRDRD